MHRLAVSLFAVVVFPSLAWAVCAGGTPAGGSCGSVPAGGCCNWQAGGGFSEVLQWCDNGTLCQRDCEAEGGWDSLYCGYSDLTSNVTCGELMDVSSYDPNYDMVDCQTYTGGGTDPGTELPGTGTGQPCGDIGYAGCCDGQVVTWCEGGELRVIDCAETPSCGWNSEGGFYDCGGTGAADPSGANPLNCDGTGGTGPITSGCGSVTYEGCCNGSTVAWCEGGAVQQINCATEPQAPGTSCGWDPDGGYYWCGTSTASDPSGANPRTCDAGGSVGPCTPDCLGKLCGNDGCGGQCGSCGPAQECVGGQCIASEQCTPTCKRGDGTLKECGDNGCGGMCGSCAIGKVCTTAGACAEPGSEGTCDPGCGNRECGPDGCDGTCGECAAGFSCSATATCVKGDTPAATGDCPAGQFLYYGVCVSEDGTDNRDPVNEAVDDGTATGGKSGCAVSGAASPLAGVVLLLALLGLLASRARRAAVTARRS